VKRELPPDKAGREWQRGEAEKALQRLISSPEESQIPTRRQDDPAERSLAERQAEWNAKMRAMYARWDAEWALRGGEQERDRVRDEAMRLSSLRSPPRHRKPPAALPGRARTESPRGSSRKAIPQSVKVAVAARDRGKCHCRAGICGHRGMCGSTEEPHYDHIIPWSKGGTDTADNLQILCGPCNRRKGADDIT
jgi:5-methylcytosine-specific restriction endonuclease McrA